MDAFADEGLEDAVEVVGRAVSDAGQPVQGQVFLQVGLDKELDLEDAPAGVGDAAGAGVPGGRAAARAVGPRSAAARAGAAAVVGPPAAAPAGVAPRVPGWLMMRFFYLGSERVDGGRSGGAG